MKYRLSLLVTFLATTLLPLSSRADSCLVPEFAGARISGVGSLTSAGGLVQGLAVADLNGDTNLDVITVNAGCSFCTPPITNHLSILMGNGDGTFRSNFNYITTLSPQAVAVGDLNGDDRPEIAVSFTGSGAVSVYVNNGDGTFQAPISINLSNGSDYVTIADLKADGNLDLISGAEKVAAGNGNATFQTPATIAGGINSVRPAVADFDQDTKIDLAVPAFDSFTLEPRIFTVLGSADTTFPTLTNTIVGVHFVSLAAGNFNGDNFPDLVGVSLSNFVSVAINKGDGTFQTNVNYTIGTNGFAVAVDDFDGDHNADIAVVSTHNAVSVLLGNGNGTFQPAINYFLGGNSTPSHIAIGDVNNDGIPDIITGNVSGGNGVSLMLGNGDGTFQIAPAYRTGRGPINPQAADLNGDGNRDLVVANSFSNNVSVFINNGDGTFGTNVNYVTGRSPDSIAIADFNKDSIPDMITANTLTNRVSLRLGLGDGTFQTNVNVTPVLVGSWGAVAGDFNGDGKADFVLGGLATNSQAGMSVYISNGNGTFRSPITTVTTPLSVAGDQVITGDFNNDNKLDIAYAKSGSNIVCVILGNGSGGFGVNNNFPMGSNIVGVAAADFNNDGKLDLVTADYDCTVCSGTNPRGGITVRLGNGNGTFQPPINRSLPTYFPYGITTGDFNADGNPDVALTDTIVGEVYVLLGNGNGTFGDPVRFAVQLSPESVIAADLDANGTIDLVTENHASDTLSVLLNTCPFAPAVGLALTLSPPLATNTVSTAHTVTATVTSNGVAKAGVVINFNVTSGPNIGQTGSATSSVTGQGSFTYNGSATIGTDFIRAIAGNATGTATKVWIAAGPNLPPVAVCHNVTTNAGANCTVNVPATAVDNGSSDPDGVIVSRSLTPAGPYPKGVTSVTLSVVDNQSATNTCEATITVNDLTAPTVNCPGTVFAQTAAGQSNVVVTFNVTFSDGCGLSSSNTVPPSGSVFDLGTNAVISTAVDTAGNTNSCTFNVIVQETPPVPHDLAVTTLKAPKKVTLKANTTPKPGKLQIAIQNQGSHAETIDSLQDLQALVGLTIQSLGDCTAPTATLLSPVTFPITLSPKKSLKLTYSVAITCANDPAATSKTVAHNDYRYTVLLDHPAIDGNADTTPANDVCPRAPSGSDKKGCGGKGGTDVFTDVVMK